MLKGSTPGFESYIGLERIYIKGEGRHGKMGGKKNT